MRPTNYINYNQMETGFIKTKHGQILFKHNKGKKEKSTN